MECGADFKIIISQKSNAVESNHGDESDMGGIYITILEKHFSAKVYWRCTKRSKLQCLTVDSVVNATLILTRCSETKGRRKMKNKEKKKTTRNYHLLTKLESGKCRRVTAANDVICLNCGGI